MSLAKASIFTLFAAVFALSVWCSGAAGPAGNGAIASGGSDSRGAAGAAPSAGVAALETRSPSPRSADGALSEPGLPAASLAETAPPAAAAAAPVHESAMHALNQMVTAQALLVSLLLAPLSKEGVEGPLAQAHATPAGAPTR
jgi:hypothetical protein